LLTLDVPLSVAVAATGTGVVDASDVGHAADVASAAEVPDLDLVSYTLGAQGP
jgi:hypothetical protein